VDIAGRKAVGKREGEVIGIKRRGKYASAHQHEQLVSAALEVVSVEVEVREAGDAKTDNAIGVCRTRQCGGQRRAHGGEAASIVIKPGELAWNGRALDGAVNDHFAGVAAVQEHHEVFIGW